MMDDNSVRAVNIITRPDHDIWKITNGKDMRAWFQKAFPRFRFTKDGDGHGDGELISMEEWNRFAEAQGTRFPPCQYSPGLQATPGDGECGVVLVGDAIHAFPPDIGQGINSGLEDVCALDTALKGGDGSNMNANKSLGSRLQDYEKNRLPEVSCLYPIASQQWNMNQDFIELRESVYSHPSFHHFTFFVPFLSGESTDSACSIWFPISI